MADQTGLFNGLKLREKERKGQRWRRPRDGGAASGAVRRALGSSSTHARPEQVLSSVGLHKTERRAIGERRRRGPDFNAGGPCGPWAFIWLLVFKEISGGLCGPSGPQMFEKKEKKGIERQQNGLWQLAGLRAETNREIKGNEGKLGRGPLGCNNSK